MEDSNLLYYLVIGGIYVISKFLKKKKPAAPTGESGEEEVQKPQGPSFEELLKGITGQKEENELERPVESYNDREIIETPAIPQNETLRSPEVQIAEGLQETKGMDRNDEIVREKPKYERAKEYEIEEEEVDSEVASDIMDLLSDVHGAKRVIIANEILQRKY